MKYFSRILLIAGLAFCLSSCTDILVQEIPEAGEVPVRITFSMADKAVLTKSKVSGTETVVTVMQLVCFDADGKYLGIRNAEVTSNGASGTFYDTGVIKGSVPQNTARIHFIANRNLGVPLIDHSVGESESAVMKSAELSTAYDDTDHQKVCYWGYHTEDNANAMNEWLNPAEGSNHIVYLIRDRAKVVLTYDPTDATIPVTKIEWLIHNGRERGYLAPAEANWTNTGYYGNSTVEGHTSEIVSIAGINEYSTSNRYSLWISETENDENNFDVAYQSTGTFTAKPQFLFDDDNAEVDNLKVIIRVTYTVSGAPKVVYHVLRLNQKDEENPDDPATLYDIVRNNTYYVKCKMLNPDVAAYETLKEAIEGEEFVNADVEIDRTIPDINNDTYTLQIKLPNEGTSVVLSTEGEHTMDFVYRLVSDVNTPGSTVPDDFDVYWEKSQTFCDEDINVTYDSNTKQFSVHVTVLEGKLTDHLQEEWIVIENKTSHLKRYIHVYVIDQFRYKLDPKLTKVGNDYMLSFTLPPMEHTQFLPDGSGDPDELIYPASLYPIDVKFTTNTLNAYGTTQGTTSYGLFGVSVEGTSQLCDDGNFESGFDSPISSTNDTDRIHWYYQQADNYWDFWYTYSLKTYPTNGEVKIFFSDIRDHIQYANVEDVGLFLYVDYFGKNYSVPIKGVSLDVTSAIVVIGETLQLEATVIPSDLELTWESSDTSVATVSDSGLVTVASTATPGTTATITVSANNGEYTASCVVTATNEVTKTITVNSSNVTTGNNKTVTNNPVSITFSNVYDVQSGYIRPGRSATTTITAGNRPIKRVVVHFSANSYTTTYTPNTGSGSSSGNSWIWTGNTTSLTLTQPNDRNSRVTSIEVTYEK